MTLSVREKIQFLLDIKSNRRDFQDIFSIELAAFMKNHRLWYTVQDLKEASNWDKLIYYLRPIISFICMVPASLHLILNFNEQSLDITMQKFAYLATLYLGFFMILQSMSRRKEASQLLTTLNEMSQINMAKANHIKYRPRRNRIYLVVFLIPSSFAVLALVPLPILIEPFRSGELYFKSAVPSGGPFSAVNYVEAVIYYLVFFIVYIFGMTYFGILLENYLQVVLNYSILADELRALRRPGKMVSEGEEYEKLRHSMIVCNDLKRCLDLANKICHTFFMGFVPGIFVNVGLFLALAFSLESRWDIMMTCIYPMYLYLFMSFFCLLGQSVVDSADSLRNAIYECNWYDAPLRFKKMVLLFQIQCERPLRVDLRPFWVLNLELLLRVAKTTYIIMAVVRKLSY